MSRDPIGERGGVNLYGLGPNSPPNGYDDLGANWIMDFWYDWFMQPIPNNSPKSPVGKLILGEDDLITSIKEIVLPECCCKCKLCSYMFGGFHPTWRLMCPAAGVVDSSYQFGPNLDKNEFPVYREGLYYRDDNVRPLGTHVGCYCIEKEDARSIANEMEKRLKRQGYKYVFLPGLECNGRMNDVLYTALGGAWKAHWKLLIKAKKCRLKD